MIGAGAKQKTAKLQEIRIAGLAASVLKKVVWVGWLSKSVWAYEESHLSAHIQTPVNTVVLEVNIDHSWRRKWQPTPVFLPGEFHGQRGLVGCNPWGCKESDLTERLSIHTCTDHCLSQSNHHLPPVLDMPWGSCLSRTMGSGPQQR